MGEQKRKKNISVGLLAHVDAGKTTLSEGLLYLSGSLKKLGRVDHKDAFLDTDSLERERGITIFSKQAMFTAGDTRFTLLDTPGHVDFSTEMERTLQVLDAAILVISGVDGVQGHTETLWRLLEEYRIPTFLFVNKMDLAGADKTALLAQLQSRLSEGCVDFTAELGEEAAVCDEGLLEEYLEHGGLARSSSSMIRAISARRLFPCWFGSALKLEGVEDFLQLLEELCPSPVYRREFGGKVFKISRDAQGNRLTWLKVTGGTLKPKTVLSGITKGESWTEKADQLRLYSGVKFAPLDAAPAGTVCAVTGLTRTFPGQGLGTEPDSPGAALEPVLNYRVELPQETDVHTALLKLRELEEEDPQLHILWNEHLRELHIQLMGPVQVEILTRRIQERFGLMVTFGEGNIVYRETITAPVVGVGHFEPLRHYAEVLLLLEPGQRGSGLVFRSDVSENDLDLNWQRLILTHMAEKTHLGVLTGSPITDMVITLIAGKAHLKHTEGGDFRQATYRAIRQGLRQAESLLLEPWYDFRLDLPAENVGRAMNDLQQRSGTFDPPELAGDRAVLTGFAPAGAMKDYATEVMAYTRGRGQLTFRLKGYLPCHNAPEVIAQLSYDPDSDVENTADSVFCSHGAGHVVKWDEVSQHQHLTAPVSLTGETDETPAPTPRRRSSYADAVAQDKELQAIFEQTYGPVKQRRAFDSPRKVVKLADKVTIKEQATPEEYLLVDGYNIIFAWNELKRLAETSLDSARQTLMDDLCSYQAHKQCHVILVFDAYKVRGGKRHVEQYHNIHVVYTQEAETADQYIEQASYKLGKHYRVRVATSDGLEQIIVLGHGCLRISAKIFQEEMDMVKADIQKMIREHNQKQ